MKDILLRFNCFLTGYSYEIIKQCSEQSKKKFKKITSSLYIICILWGVIGYTFTSSYMNLGNVGALIAAITMIFIVIQIERQIILSIVKNTSGKIFRFILAIIMSCLGAIVLDKYVFKDDIKIAKISDIEKKVNKNLPSKVKEIDDEIAVLDSLIYQKDKERTQMLIDVDKSPNITSYARQVVKKPGQIEKEEIDSLGQVRTYLKDTTFTETTWKQTPITNPKYKEIEKLNSQIEDFRNKRDIKLSKKSQVREDLEKEYKEKHGFLDELSILISIITSSWLGIVVFGLWFSFIMFLELLVLVAVKGRENTDYDETIKHQCYVKKEILKKLSSSDSDNSKST